jgi:hypothetical protein
MVKPPRNKKREKRTPIDSFPNHGGSTQKATLCLASTRKHRCIRKWKQETQLITDSWTCGSQAYTIYINESQSVYLPIYACII